MPPVLDAGSEADSTHPFLVMELLDGVDLQAYLDEFGPHAEGETRGGLMVAICGKPAKPLRQLAPHVSPEVEAIVAKALSLDPAQRYPTAEALREAIEHQLPFGTKLERSLLDR